MLSIFYANPATSLKIRRESALKVIITIAADKKTAEPDHVRLEGHPRGKRVTHPEGNTQKLNVQPEVEKFALKTD